MIPYWKTTESWKNIGPQKQLHGITVIAYWKTTEILLKTRKKGLDSEGKPVALVLEDASIDHRKSYSKVQVVLAVVGNFRYV